MVLEERVRRVKLIKRAWAGTSGVQNTEVVTQWLPD